MKAENAEKEREHAMEVKEIRKSLQNEKQILKRRAKLCIEGKSRL